jgi:hypothetical protein
MSPVYSVVEMCLELGITPETSLCVLSCANLRSDRHSLATSLVDRSLTLCISILPSILRIHYYTSIPITLHSYPHSFEQAITYHSVNQIVDTYIRCLLSTTTKRFTQPNIDFLSPQHTTETSLVRIPIADTNKPPKNPPSPQSPSTLA